LPRWIVRAMMLRISYSDWRSEVELFGVERADFYRDLFILQSGFAFAEARHRFYHCGGC